MLKINKCMKNVNFKISDSTKKFLFAVALTFCVAGVYAQDRGITNIYYKCYSKTVFSQKYT